MLTVDDVMAKLRKIANSRALVKAASLPEPAKLKLYAQLDAQAKALEVELIGSSSPPGETGAVQAPQGAQARPK